MLLDLAHRKYCMVERRDPLCFAEMSARFDQAAFVIAAQSRLISRLLVVANPTIVRRTYAAKAIRPSLALT
jgi:hypothetical protein